MSEELWREVIRTLDSSVWLNWATMAVIIDVLLVWALIYHLFLLVRGTRAQPMLLGLGMIVIAYVVSRKLGLVTLNWLLSNFLGSVILVVVVLFREDLSRALIKVGLISGFGSEAPHTLELSIREITQAAIELARRRIGALIVIRRDIGLEEYSEQAVQIDGLVTRQLLISIFQPSSPLHDGAVIVEGNKILVAGAVLPLSHEAPVAANFGTRHRAALGLSERTDAVVVVVSEEQGIVSLVREGRITRDLSEKTLYNALFRLTVFRQAKRGKYLFRNIGKSTKASAKEVNIEGGSADKPSLEV